jgi:hypothetical protein
MTTLFLADATTYTPDQLARIVAEQLEEGRFSQADSLRSAVMYCPLTMSPGEWVAACASNGIKANTARNRLSEVRRWQSELGEVS